MIKLKFQRVVFEYSGLEKFAALKQHFKDIANTIGLEETGFWWTSYQEWFQATIEEFSTNRDVCKTLFEGETGEDDVRREMVEKAMLAAAEKARAEFIDRMTTEQFRLYFGDKIVQRSTTEDEEYN